MDKYLVKRLTSLSGVVPHLFSFINIHNSPQSPAAPYPGKYQDLLFVCQYLYQFRQ